VGPVAHALLVALELDPLAPGRVKRAPEQHEQNHDHHGLEDGHTCNTMKHKDNLNIL